MAIASQTQRTFLFCFIGSIVLCGLIGAYSLLFSQMGSFEAKVIGSTACIGAAAILAMGSTIAWERRRWPPIGLLGLIATAIALCWVLAGIWIELRWFEFGDFYRGMFVSCILAVALVHVALLSLARLKRSYEWVRIGTVVLIAFLVLLTCSMILFEISDEGAFRLMGVLAIGDVCGTLAVPILQRISGIQVRENIVTTQLTMSLTCPRCAVLQQVPVGRSKCNGCGLKFNIEIEEEHCPKCGYSLYQLQSNACPECGTPISAIATH